MGGELSSGFYSPSLLVLTSAAEKAIRRLCERLAAHGAYRREMLQRLIIDAVPAGSGSACAYSRERIYVRAGPLDAPSLLALPRRGAIRYRRPYPSV